MTATPVRVLVVDDAPTVRFYHRAILARAGFEVTEAGNGLEALELALDSEFDLMVVDVNMPQMDGLTLVERLRSTDVGCSCPIITVTTESRDADAEAAYRSGASFYLVKPVAPDQLTLIAQTLTAPLPTTWSLT